jgi:leucyl-tRNA synthetase
MEGYDHKKIEKKWSELWKKSDIYKSADSVKGKENFYLLTEFPYPSGNLHVGHWYAFALPDILARYMRMKGKNVLFPMGFDAFGLPAENAAIKNKLNPRKWTEKNIEYMHEQMASMGASFDWSREVQTIDPKYYKWTQWQFLQFFKKGLVYQKDTAVNWCPKDKTVLANEQVVDGKCERCDSVVEQKMMLQWNIKITEYADRLIDDLEPLEWPQEIKESQKNWIGRSQGAEIDFFLDFGDPAVNDRVGPDGKKAHITVFTTRPDTLFGATYLVLSPEHTWVQLALGHKRVLKNNEEVQAYVEQAKRRSDLERQMDQKEKTGVKLEGVHALNPATGEKIPMYTADYVLATYGTGAIMAVPAHDERDHQFAKKFDLPITHVVSGAAHDAIYTGEGELMNSGEFNGNESVGARITMTEKFGRKKTTYKLRDWIVSRQRYWGVPIPIIHCEKCGQVAVPNEDLPVRLPEVEDYLPSGDGKSPLAKVAEFVNVKCPKCGVDAKRETDTLDTFVDSSWYFLRYTDPKNDNEFAAREKQYHWMPVDLYSGGAEHTTMHLLYSRFWHKALYDLGLVADPEPYKRRMNRSLIMGPDGQKMSKSRGNVIDPDQVVERLGADTVRMYLAFIGPYNEVSSYPWNPDGVVGVRRFLERVFRMQEVVQKDDIPELNAALHRTIKKVGDDIEVLKFNTAISQLMIFLNEAEKQNDKKGGIGERQWHTLMMLLEPFAPFMADELWSRSGHKTALLDEDWPKYDETKMRDTKMTIAVQVNGKTKAQVQVPADADKGAQEEAAKLSVEKRMLGQKIEKVIVVPGRLVNFVLENSAQ